MVFIERMIPVCEEADVRLALHPNDPPTDGLGGIPCLIRNWASYDRAFAIADSPYLGMEFCVGCWLEGGESFGNVLDGIRHFHELGKTATCWTASATSTSWARSSSCTSVT